MAPYSWTIEDARRTIVVRGYGEGTTADTLELIDAIGRELRDREGYDFIYNSSALSIESSPADMMRIASALFQEGGLRASRFALVVPARRVALARIFAALAQPFGVVVDVFWDEDGARDWLGDRRARGTLEVRPTGPAIPSRDAPSPARTDPTPARGEAASPNPKPEP